MVKDIKKASDDDLAVTNALVHNFLKSNGHEDVATAFKKSLKKSGTIKTIKTGKDVDTSLLEVVRKWRTLKGSPRKEVNGNSTKSGFSSSRSPDLGKKKDVTKQNIDGKPSLGARVPIARSSEPRKGDNDSDDNSGSETESDSSSSSAKSSSSSDSSSSSSSSSSTDSSEDEKDTSARKVKKPTTPKVDSKAETDSDDEDSDSSDDSDSSGSDDEPGESNAKQSSSTKPITNGSKKRPAKDDSSSDSSDSSTDSEEKPTKKQRTSVGGTAVVTASTSTEKVESGLSTASKPLTIGTEASILNREVDEKGKKNEKAPRKSNTPFQRIKVDGVTFANEKLKDNSFAARGGKSGDYGERASADLIVTRGSGFRKEKNKKKRGSYRGGDITLDTHSIKFE